jgi:hypothetical protein
MKLSNVTSERKKLTCHFTERYGDDLHLVYIPGMLTPEVEDELQESLEAPGSGRFVCEFLAKLVEDWDLVDDDGTPIALDADGLRVVPIPFLGDVLAEIRKDMNPGEETAD